MNLNLVCGSKKVYCIFLPFLRTNEELFMNCCFYKGRILWAQEVEMAAK